MLAALLLAGCGQPESQTLAIKVCRTVTTSLRLERQAAGAPSNQAAQIRRHVIRMLQAVEPSAAIAAGEDGQWQALQATLGEVGIVPVRLLAQALSAQCSGVS